MKYEFIESVEYMLLLVKDTILYRNEVPSTEVTTVLYISYEKCKHFSYRRD